MASRMIDISNKKKKDPLRLLTKSGKVHKFRNPLRTKLSIPTIAEEKRLVFDQSENKTTRNVKYGPTIREFYEPKAFNRIDPDMKAELSKCLLTMAVCGSSPSFQFDIWQFFIEKIIYDPERYHLNKMWIVDADPIIIDHVN